MDKPLRILLVDDHMLFRGGIAALLERREDVKVVGEAGDGLEAIDLARETKPDVILMDIEMPKMSGLEAVRVITEEMPDVKVIMLTVSDDNEHLFEAIRNGAAGYLLKNMPPRAVYEAIDGIRSDGIPLGGKIAAKILHGFRETQNQTEEKKENDTLTKRELDVLAEIVEGKSNFEISQSLFLTENTVKIHILNILRKLHLHNRTQAAVYAVRTGLLDQQTK